LTEARQECRQLGRLQYPYRRVVPALPHGRRLFLPSAKSMKFEHLPVTHGLGQSTTMLITHIGCGVRHRLQVVRERSVVG
jgi:hypothetical protein